MGTESARSQETKDQTPNASMSTPSSTATHGGGGRKRSRRSSSALLLPYPSSSSIEVDASGVISGRVVVSETTEHASACSSPAPSSPVSPSSPGPAVIERMITTQAIGEGGTAAALSGGEGRSPMLPSVVEMLAVTGRLGTGGGGPGGDDDLIVVRMDADGVVKEWNDTAARIMGWTSEDAREKPLIENFVIPELQPMAKQVFEDGLKGRSTKFVMEVKTKCNETRFLLVDASPLRDPQSGDIVGLASQSRDVTREARYDMAVRAMLADNRATIQTANAPIFGTDRNGRVNEWNEYCIATTGFVTGDIMGRPFVETLITNADGPSISNQESAKDVLDRVLRKRERIDGCELTVATKNGGESRIWVVNVRPRLDPSGNVFGAIGVAKDVTDDRRLAKQLRQMEITNRAQEAMLDSERDVTAYVAHELRNPLHAIDSALHSMPPDEMSDSTKSLVDAMQLCTDFMSSVMNNLLDVRKMEEGKMVLKKDAMSISRLLRGVHDMLAPSVREGVELLIDCRTEGHDNDWVYGDPHRIQQVLTNIVTNSIKYTTTGSIILRAAWENDAGRFEIVDTGPGIPKGEQERIFEKFVQRGGAPGTGLGLAIAKNVVDMYRGSIWFESDPAKKPGTKCTIVLPLLACETTPDMHEEESATRIDDALSFLIVDDIPMNRTMLSRRLKQGIAPNASVREVQNGEEALELCQMEKFDVVLVDHYMREAGGVMIGPDVVIALRRIGVDAIIIGCSGSDHDAAFWDAGCDLVWSKPMPSNATAVKQLMKLLPQKINQ